MKSPEALIAKYYADNAPLHEILLVHSRMVAEYALACVDRHPELKLDRTFVYEAALFHDIGIFLTDAPAIHCHGTEHYLCHGLLGAELLRKEGLPRHARVAERHTGTGLTAQQIVECSLPLPEQDFCPETLEEQLICYADKFYSKTKLRETKPVERVMHDLAKFSGDGLDRFKRWMDIFS